MADEVSFGEFVREIGLKQKFISYNEITPKPKYDSDGKAIPYRPGKLDLRNIDIYRLLTPYVGIRLIDQLRAVVPLALYLAFFQMLILKQYVADHWTISAGLVAVIIGLMVFMEGLKLGLMPFGEMIGNRLPKKSRLSVVLLVAFLLGVGVTLAEPAIGALQIVGSIVDVKRAPYLYTLLNDWSGTLVLAIGAGVGLAAVLGTMRFLYGWSLKPLIYLAMIPSLGLTIYGQMDPELSKILGLAWDCGAVTTGPITVPLVLALGIGIAAAAGKGGASLSGFGIVTLASLFPIIGVMTLALYVASTTTPDAIIEAAKTASLLTETPYWFDKTPFVEIIGGFRALVPLLIFLFLVLKYVIREKIDEAGFVAYGLTLALLGMIVFNLGLSYGLAKLGGQSGSLVPAAFATLEGIKGSPFYDYSIGILIALIFAWILGFGATMAEPALNALGITVENLTNGTFKKSMLIYSVSIGVGFGIMIGILKVIYEIPIAYIILPGYGLALVLTFFSTEEFVNVAWDSAGVTTGPVTVPLVLAMGLGFGNAVNAVDGFGILSMASICPILSVLAMGIFIRLKRSRLEKIETKKPEIAGVPTI